MQLRMLARRSTGPMTILGDIAQAAGPIAYRGWDDLLPYLAPDVRRGRGAAAGLPRAARRCMELALPLLPLIAPDVAPPIAYREGDEPPRFVQAEPRRTSSPRPCARPAARRSVKDGRR